MEYNKKNLLKGVKKSWKKFLKDQLNDENLKKINEDRKKFRIFPEPKLVFNTLKHFELNELKIVLLGQDPYIRYEIHNDKLISQAMGLAFSVSKEIKKIPPSLKNIFKELKNSIKDFKIPDNGDLTRWVKDEKILLLNSGLTVIEGKSNSHQKLWESLTDSIIKYISDNTTNTIFILLGNFAKNKSKLIDLNKHYIIKGVHPSPLSASRGFFGSNIFNKANEILKEEGEEEINWKL